jgi:Xaa-Pro aminopeptidase
MGPSAFAHIEVFVNRPTALLVLALLAAPLKLEAQIGQREYEQRRAALIARLPDTATVVVFGADEPEQDYLEFNQHPGMLYLTGVREPEAGLILIKRGAAAPVSVLFVQPRDPAAEVWTGLRMGPEAATRVTGIPARSSEDFHEVIDSLAGVSSRLFVVGEVRDLGLLGNDLNPVEQFVQSLQRNHPNTRIVTAANGLVMQLRGTKSPAELALIKRSVEITVASQEAAMRAARPSMFEYELEAIIEAGFRKAGAERPSFATIVGSGPNSTILHYNVNDRQMRAGEVVVMDIGSSYMGYAADVTRTIPLSGTFSPAQRQIYQIVRDAQSAAERNARPGMRSQIMADSAAAVVAAGLARLGLVDSATATYDVVGPNGTTVQEPQFTLYYMHGLGHGIGLEVHDPEQFYYTGTIAEGSAFSIEPGIYVRPNLLEILADTPRNRALIAKIRPAVERYKNTGVRIEDDYVVTDKGLEWISRAPREIAEIEALMRRPVP